jgi:hypothetical protein
VCFFVLDVPVAEDPVVLVGAVVTVVEVGAVALGAADTVASPEA